ncbi:DnaB-like helicase N-terminal domain-containing protein [Saccharopolyspora pogona]|uniref:DnaB-like helicase N-terminal domain-containing protein n=1 Tax=Saccharopolyspora pogona TaxID=333966 RepID=UPI0016899851|nr:DnaB-like helicase N-terminal domain-containing protein [Saccharopolyspora pogona]
MAMTPREFAERSLLGVLLDEPGRLRDLDYLRAEDFRSPAYQVLYRTLGEMVAEADAALAETLADEDFDWQDEMLGDDLVVGGVAYDRTEYKIVDGEVERRSAEETRRLREEQAHEDYQVPGVDPVTVHTRLRESGDPQVMRSQLLTAPGLHTLMATAPARSAQPEAYAQIVLESSIRRQVEAAGLRVGHAADTSPELAGLLAVVDTALAEVDDARQRWEALHPSGDAAPAPHREHLIAVQADAEVWLDLPQQALVDAETGLVAEALTTPRILAELAAQVQPGDFGDKSLGATWAAAVEVHAASATRGPHVDPVTVAWQQQRQAAVHGEGLPVEQLAELSQSGSLGAGHAHRCANVVLRGSLIRLTTTAARSVTDAAQQPGLQPSDVLHTSTLALQAVVATARRVGSPAAQLARQAAPGPPAREVKPEAQGRGERPPIARCTPKVQPEMRR